VEKSSVRGGVPATGAEQRESKMLSRNGQKGRIPSAYLAQAYADLTVDRDRLSDTIGLLRPYHAAERILGWHALAAAGQMADLARELVSHHYDPKYARQRGRDAPPELGTVALPGFDDAALEAAAQDILSLAERSPARLSPQ
jgi:tRNA 2-selenouridine synthase